MITSCDRWPRSDLRIMLTGGDTLHHYPPADLPFLFINNYGPTECTVVATSGRVLPQTSPETLPSMEAASRTRISMFSMSTCSQYRRASRANSMLAALGWRAAIAIAPI
jgi:hypothetical protein